jgi:hypothetical protein
MVRNMVGDLKEQKWVGSLGDEVKDIAESKVKPLADTVGVLAEKVESGSASPARLEPIIAEQREVEAALDDLVDRMTQFGDINQLVRQLQEILGVEEQVKQATKDLMGRE